MTVVRNSAYWAPTLACPECGKGYTRRSLRLQAVCRRCGHEFGMEELLDYDAAVLNWAEDIVREYARLVAKCDECAMKFLGMMKPCESREARGECPVARRICVAYDRLHDAGIL